ncbi:MAG: lipid-A-disaccharide synthase [Alphaproteobacteria bacterium]|nr:lipid-A-disaccharide synthase [Alphaproteobacteria bacterium]
MRVALLAGEASGDQLAASLARALPGASLWALAGPALRALDVEPLGAIEELSIVGFPARELPRLLALRSRVRRELRRVRPDVVVTVDSPSFTLRTAAGLGIPHLHWVSPQIWAWRRHRAARIARSTDALAALLPFEPGLYAGTGLDVRFTGHPAAAGGLVPLGTAVGLAAGSRPSERARLGPAFRAALRGLDVVEAVPPGRAPVMPEARHVTGVPALAGEVRAALVCSGTATLELAARGVPMVSAYDVPRLTRAVARRLLHIDTVTLPNLVLGRRVVPELLDAPRPDVLRAALDRVLEAPEVQRDAFAELEGLLAPEGSVERVAQWVEALGRRG